MRLNFKSLRARNFHHHRPSLASICFGLTQIPVGFDSSFFPCINKSDKSRWIPSKKNFFCCGGLRGWEPAMKWLCGAGGMTNSIGCRQWSFCALSKIWFWTNLNASGWMLQNRTSHKVMWCLACSNISHPQLIFRLAGYAWFYKLLYHRRKKWPVTV